MAFDNTADSVYDEVEIEDMEYVEEEGKYYYPCPCGDRFEISKELLEEGETIASCPSCSLRLRVVYDPDDFAPDDDEEAIQLTTTITVV
ncbi:Diphthamide biosynthesis protein 3 [Coemansia sp. BCRC 34490]|nr:Diphthamide biosynthesis protein 3 [Coemansia sp. Benny D160-2]KAJ2510567.1 Diphthamide biosynthesis protein 3 [Coemansia sp. RSA 2049]KAJ2511101.1 Diphthamide biosynthesis protein 3 [Coemansia sp. RSA 1939]KAJ2608327.1 Diphthamide biosynthesis protein 3 [Coemansia sp. RSA 1804]KAJ2674789.1 Diphthamide biosynthesis protein 3 [Coemansia sp. RSA 1285]KAJ2742619.1 Diphthamide biosynthesis protein 3 [Coemansia sp. BCRC 34490]